MSSTCHRGALPDIGMRVDELGSGVFQVFLSNALLPLLQVIDRGDNWNERWQEALALPNKTDFDKNVRRVKLDPCYASFLMCFEWVDQRAIVFSPLVHEFRYRHPQNPCQAFALPIPDAFTSSYVLPCCSRWFRLNFLDYYAGKSLFAGDVSTLRPRIATCFLCASLSFSMTHQEYELGGSVLGLRSHSRHVRAYDYIGVLPA